MNTTAPTKFDFDRLTLGEIATIEDLTGYGIGSLDETKPQGKFLAALYMVARRRDGEPTFTFNAALNVEIHDANAYLGLDGDDDDDEQLEDDASAEGESLDVEATVSE